LGGGPQAPVGQGLLIHEVSRSHNDVPHSVGLLWTSDQSVAETSTCTTDNTHNKHPYHQLEFEPTISAGERPKTHFLDRAATGIGIQKVRKRKIIMCNCFSDRASWIDYTL